MKRERENIRQTDKEKKRGDWRERESNKYSGKKTKEKEREKKNEREKG